MKSKLINISFILLLFSVNTIFSSAAENEALLKETMDQSQFFKMEVDSLRAKKILVREFVTIDGETPLRKAIWERRDRITPQDIESLVKNNANVNEQNSKKRTPLMMASYIGRTDLIQPLINLSANVNAEDEGGYTPLRLAANIKIKKILLQNNAKFGSAVLCKIDDTPIIDGDNLTDEEKLAKLKITGFFQAIERESQKQTCLEYTKMIAELEKLAYSLKKELFKEKSYLSILDKYALDSYLINNQ